MSSSQPEQRVRPYERGNGPVVVITGATAGVGRATARRFAKAGAAIGLIARDPPSLWETKTEIEMLGGRAIAVPADVSDAEAVFAAARTVEATLGPIEVWVNDAMLTVFSPVARMTAEEFRRVTEVTYLGFVYGTMAALRAMQPRNRGVIVQVGSSLAYRGIPLQSAYCGAKHAVRGFTDALRTELLHDRSGIALTMVQLPGVNTPQFDWARTHMKYQPRPVPPVIRPEVAAEAIFRAARSPRREIWVGLSTAQVILGSMVAPALLDRYLARNAYEGQETGRIVAADRPDNLTSPVRNAHRTRGSFRREASGTALVLSGGTARLAIAALGLGLGVAGAAWAGAAWAAASGRARNGSGTQP